MGRGGYRPGAGRKPGSKKGAEISEETQQIRDMLALKTKAKAKLFNNLLGKIIEKMAEHCQRVMQHFKASIVYDPFLGSGTTLIACENLKRRCFGIEISPDYVAGKPQRNQVKSQRCEGKQNR